MPKSLYFTLFLSVFTVCTNQIFAQPEVLARADSTIRAYIESHKAFAIAEMRRTGIPASVTLGQAICESRYGTSKVAMQAHNHFGIKCYDTWPGKRYFHKDDEMKNGVLVPSCFRYYATDSASYSDHSDFLMSRPWYEKLFEYESDDYMSWIKGLNKAGYANAKDYDERILKHINKYELYKLDEKGFSLKRNKIAKIDTKKGGKNQKKINGKPINDAPIFIKKDSLTQIRNNEDEIENEVENTKNIVKNTQINEKKPVFIAKDTLRQKEVVIDSTEIVHAAIDNAPAKIQIENEVTQPEKVPEKEIEAPVVSTQKPKLQRFTIGKTDTKPVEIDTAATIEKTGGSMPFDKTAQTELPQKTEISSAAKTDTQPQSSTPKTHKIAANETLFAIAKKYNMQMDKLMTLNNLTIQTPLKTGRILRLQE